MSLGIYDTIEEAKSSQKTLQQLSDYSSEHPAVIYPIFLEITVFNQHDISVSSSVLSRSQYNKDCTALRWVDDASGIFYVKNLTH